MAWGRSGRHTGLVAMILATVVVATAGRATAQPVRQAVIETSAGTMVWDLLTDKAPNHVALFVKTTQAKGFDGTIFHNMVPRGAIQGGDPLTRDPKMRAKYGTGGLGKLPLEPSDERMTRGAVASVRVSGRPDTGGTQFLLCVGDQPGLQDKFTIFARVAEGMRVAEKIAETPLDADGLAAERVTITRVTLRDKPAPLPDPFSTESVEQLAAYRAVLETSMGNITVALTPDKAPDHVRQFLRLAESGVYTGMSFHRVVKGFVVQTGHVPTRREPLDERQQGFVRSLKAEFNDQPHVLGTLSMARLEAPDSATSSFFIVTGTATALDGQYSAFGRVVEGLDVVQKIEAVPVDGETPVDRVELVRIRVLPPQ